MAISMCIGCGCTDVCACENGCWWLRVDQQQQLGVCSECEQHVAAWDRGERDPLFTQKTAPSAKAEEHLNPPAKPIACDARCGDISTRWFGHTSVRICENPACRDYFQRDYDEVIEKALAEGNGG